MPRSGATPRVRTVDPPRIRLHGAVALPRTIRADARGFLVETLRKDDRAVAGERFAMSYTSVTIPGEMRDRDRWHVHQRQQDRFVVPLGEMILALFDARERSPTHGELELVRMSGAPLSSPGPTGKRDLPTFLVSVPEGVYHCIGNLHPTDPFVLQNFPTELYDASDEGRVPFAQVPVRALSDQPFAWERVEVVR